MLARIAAGLDRAGIPYMVIGGQAVQLYGEPRMTRDIDITVGLTAEGLPRLLAVCTDLHLRVLVEHPAEFVGKTMVLPTLEEESAIRVDFVLSFTGYEQQAIGRSRQVELGKRKVHFASLEDLVIHKVVAGRPRDLEDTRIILVKNPGCDHAYVERWLAEFDRALSLDLVARYRELRNSLDQKP